MDERREALEVELQDLEAKLLIVKKELSTSQLQISKLLDLNTDYEKLLLDQKQTILQQETIIKQLRGAIEEHRHDLGRLQGVDVHFLVKSNPRTKLGEKALRLGEKAETVTSFAMGVNQAKQIEEFIKADMHQKNIIR